MRNAYDVFIVQQIRVAFGKNTLEPNPYSNISIFQDFQKNNRIFQYISNPRKYIRPVKFGVSVDFSANFEKFLIDHKMHL